jgi:hypothetical protein
MTLLQALVNSNGTMAQFSHWELGGGGQWMRGGMTMVGDMFNCGHWPEARPGASGTNKLTEAASTSPPFCGPPPCD